MASKILFLSELIGYYIHSYVELYVAIWQVTYFNLSTLIQIHV
jgi:hypothetical protein